MMITSSREKELGAKQEGGDRQASSSSKHWSSGQKNPRIVRVSRAFGGKDRHSKVCTVRGLRDRRIRLSIPTAIQLYELQEKLGLSQPSKVVDWLLDATKDEIDKLPPLQMPLGNFGQFHLPTLASHKSANAAQSSLSPFFNANPAHTKDEGTHSSLSSMEGIEVNFNVGDYQTMERLKARDSDAILRSKCKEFENVSEKTKWMIKMNEREHQDGSLGGYNIAQVSTQNFFPTANHSSFPTFPNNIMRHYSNYHMEPPNLSLAQLGSHGFQFQTDHVHHASASVRLPSSPAIPSASQLYFCTSAATPSVFAQYPPHITTPSLENELRQINSFQLLSSSSQSHHIPLNPRLHSTSTWPIKSSPILNMNSRAFHLHSQNNDDGQLNRDFTAGS